MSRAADLARKCFAVAKSTTHDGERSAAINRGMALLEGAGLDLDDFDIPGRARQGPQAQPWPDFMEGMKARQQAFSMDDLVREAVAESIKRRRDRAARGE